MTYNINCLSIGQNDKNEFILAYIPKYFADVTHATRIDLIKNKLIISNYKTMSFFSINSFFNFSSKSLNEQDIQKIYNFTKTEKFAKMYNKVSNNKKVHKLSNMQ